MRTEQQMTTIIIRSTKDVHCELAEKWGFPVKVIAEATYSLAIQMMLESGYTQEALFDRAREIVGDLLPSPGGQSPM